MEREGEDGKEVWRERGRMKRKRYGEGGGGR